MSFAFILSFNVYYLQYWAKKTFATYLALVVRKVPYFQRYLVAIGEDTVISRSKFLSAMSGSQGLRPLQSFTKALYFHMLQKQLA